MALQSRVMRIIAGIFGFLFFGTNCLFAYSTESNLWAERRRAREQRSSPTLLASLPVGAPTSPFFSQFPPPQKIESSLSQTVARSVPKSFLKDHAALLAALSPAYGTIRKVSLSPKPSMLSPIVIHIQDVHQNLDAQKNIGQIVGSLVNAHHADLIALEGTWGDIKLQPFRDFANRKAVELSADYLLRENKISGPIHAALVGSGPLPPLIGIDDPVHYNANVEAYRQSAPHLEELKKDLAAQKVVLDQEKKRAFSPELKTLDESVESYRSGRSSMGEYVQALANPSFHLAVPASAQMFQKTISLERTMDFKQVENERASLINRLVEKMSKPEMDELTAQSVAYRSGEVSYANFYSYLQGVCSKAGVSLHSFPAMRQYIRYVLLADGITAETLFDDLLSLERTAYSKLANTPEAMAIVKKARSAYLKGKLVGFSLTPEEWKEYRSLSIMDTRLSSFENFYREADARDRAMAENLLKAIQPGNSLPVSILVTGGYHSPGLTAQLTQAGATVISVVPKIEKLETTQGSSYLSVFTQEKTPLDKLFAGEKLFLAQKPINEGIVNLEFPAVIAVADGRQTFRTFKAAFDSMVPASVHSHILRVTEKVRRGYREILVNFKEGWTYSAVVTHEFGKEEKLRFNTEILKQSLNPIKLFEEQFFVVPASAVTVAIAAIGLAAQMPFLFPIAMIAGLLTLKQFEQSFVLFHPLENAKIFNLSYADYHAYVRQGFWFFGGLTLASLLFELSGLPGFDLQRVTLIFIQHSFGYGLLYHFLFNGLSKVKAMAKLSASSLDVHKSIVHVVGFFPAFSARRFYTDIPRIFGIGNREVDQLYYQSAAALNLYGSDGKPDPSTLILSEYAAGKVSVGDVFRNFVLFNLALEIIFRTEAAKRGIHYKVVAFTGVSAGLIVASAASGSLSIRDMAKVANYFWGNVIQSCKKIMKEQAQRYVVQVEKVGEFDRSLKKSSVGRRVFIYHFVSPSTLQVLVPLSLIPAFKEFIDSLENVKITPLRDTTRVIAHSPQLRKARRKFSNFLARENIYFRDPLIPILSNSGGEILRRADEVKRALLDIVDRAMYSDKTIRTLSKLFPDLMIEFGFGQRGKQLLDFNGSEIPVHPVGPSEDIFNALFSLIRELVVSLQEKNTMSDSGRATSLWGVKLTEVLFGKRVGIERVGNIYKALAPVIGTGLALVSTALAWGGLAFLDGSSVAGIVAPLVGAVFGVIFLASHYLLPDSWLPQSHSRKDISFPKVLTMTVLYAASIALSLWGIFDIEMLGLNSNQISALPLLSWPVALLSHGFFDGWPGLMKRLVNYLSTSQKLPARFKNGWTFSVEAPTGGHTNERQFKIEILKQSLNPLRLMQEQLFVLPAALVLTATAAIALATQTPLLFPLALLFGLLTLSRFESDFVQFHPRSNAQIFKKTEKDYDDYVRLGFWFFGGLTLLSLIISLAGLPVFDAQRVMTIFIQHGFFYGLTYHAFFNLISKVPAMSDVSPIGEETSASKTPGASLEWKSPRDLAARFRLGEKPARSLFDQKDLLASCVTREEAYRLLVKIRGIGSSKANEILDTLSFDRREDGALFMPQRYARGVLDDGRWNVELQSDDVDVYKVQIGERSIFVLSERHGSRGASLATNQLLERVKSNPRNWVLIVERAALMISGNEMTPVYSAVRQLVPITMAEGMVSPWSQWVKSKVMTRNQLATALLFRSADFIGKMAVNSEEAIVRLSRDSTYFDFLFRLVKGSALMYKWDLSDQEITTSLRSAFFNGQGDFSRSLNEAVEWDNRSYPASDNIIHEQVDSLLKQFPDRNMVIQVGKSHLMSLTMQEPYVSLTKKEIAKDITSGERIEAGYKGWTRFGRATSLWGVTLAEFLFGKRFDNDRVGKVYKALAPVIGTGLALGFTSLAWGGLVVLDGSSVAGVVAPLVGAVFGGIFLASHYLLPDSWLPKSHSRKDISFPKVLTMTILYAASITLSLWGIFDIEMLGLNSNQISALSLLSWLVAVLSHGFFDGWLGSAKKLFFITSKKILASPLAKRVVVFVLLPPFLVLGDPALSNPFALDGFASGVTGFLPFLLGSIKNHSGVGFEPGPFGHLTAVANVMDVGSFPRGNSITYERSIPKIKKLLPEYADMGVTEIYLTNGVYQLSEMGKKVHTVPPVAPIFVNAGNAISRLGGRYFTKRKWLNGTWWDDRHGSNFSMTDMRVLNPGAFDARTNEGRWAELADFVAEASRYGIKVKVDLVPWISPDGINKDNWTWAKYHQKVPEEDHHLSDEKILEKHPGNSLVKWEEDGQLVRVLVGNFSPGVDQVDPNFSDPGYQEYLIDYLHRLIDAGVESVRVDMAHRLVSQYQYPDWSAWTRIIIDAKQYAEGKGQGFTFLMEAYPEENHDWRIPFLDRFPQEAVYHVDPFHNFERIAKGDGQGLYDLKLAMEHARAHPGQWWAFPTNFDEWSLKNMGGPQEAFLALLLTYGRLGVPLMVDTRELMGQAGQNIPQAGGQDLDAKGNAKHPFPDAIVRGFYAFWRILRKSPRRQFMSEMKILFEDADTIEILDTPNEHRYFAVGVKTKSGEYKVRMWDFYPSWGEPDKWVAVPNSFLLDETVALRRGETENSRIQRVRNSFSSALSEGEVPLDLMTVTFGSEKWYRLPVVFGSDHVARLDIRPSSFSHPIHLPRGIWRTPEIREFPGATFRLIMNTPAFDTEGKSRVDFKRVENTLSLDGKDVPFTSTTLNEVRGEPPHVDPSDVLALLPNGNLGMNDWFVGFANGTFYHKSREEWQTRTYEMLVQPVEGRPRVQTLRFSLVDGKWKAYDATTFKDVTNAISFAVYGQRIVKEGVNNVENLANQFDDLRHLLRFPMFDVPGNPQFHLGFNDGSGELYHDRQKVTAALKGEPVTLSLQPLMDHRIKEADRDKVFASWGYIRRPSNTPFRDLNPGEYVVPEKGNSLTIRFLPGIHPHSFFGLSQSGELMAGLVPGQTHHEGTTVDELANHLVADKAQDVFLWANGKDAKVLGPSLSGESDNARAGFLAAIVIQHHTPSGSSDASNVVNNLDARSTDLGVDNIMDGKARLSVESAAQRAKQGGTSSAEFSNNDGKGALVLFVDFRSVKTTKARQDLAAFVHGKPHARIITDAPDLTLPGVPADRVLQRPGVFSPLRTAEGIPLGLVQVSLAGLEDDLSEISKDGNGLQFMQTAVIQLSAQGVREDHEDFLRAIEGAWVLNALFQLSVPARSLDWRGIIQTLAGIARNA